MLEMSVGEIIKFEIFVTPLFDGCIGDNGFTPDLKERKSITAKWTPTTERRQKMP